MNGHLIRVKQEGKDLIDGRVVVVLCNDGRKEDRRRDVIDGREEKTDGGVLLWQRERKRDGVWLMVMAEDDVYNLFIYVDIYTMHSLVVHLAVINVQSVQ
ncbi:hypothetical protein E3N88_20683 [Mikania micrantha]|uniref:Uncharacterized protein n=1 Tax=Mikania micrantha TaxID=192012 RepID=A0A5N6NJE1_9ASTR|nr:hypothetical protein E3N88_20683 [Mikania micrantha]